MNEKWQQCKNILIIRPDNMGDLIMSGPAIRALKQTFAAKITVLTSSMGAIITPFIPGIDDTIVFDLPWVKAKETIDGNEVIALTEQLKTKRFDAAVIFTVFSQNPLPAAMIAYMAGIPLRLAYCRENPYNLLTDWFPDEEPYNFIKHQVQRDLALVQLIRASTHDLKLEVKVSEEAKTSALQKIAEAGIDTNKQWILCHAGVSERKREYPAELWIKSARNIVSEKNLQVLFTGSKAEKELCDTLAKEAGIGVFSMAGILSLEEFIAVISMSSLLISVNTGTVHIAAATGTPTIVLYAQTNPQHTPWMVPARVLEFPVEIASRTKNQVVQELYKSYYTSHVTMPTEDDVLQAVTELLEEARTTKQPTLNMQVAAEE
jgi:lipopolysaccharide heptosyltransferase II